MNSMHVALIISHSTIACDFFCSLLLLVPFPRAVTFDESLSPSIICNPPVTIYVVASYIKPASSFAFVVDLVKILVEASKSQVVCALRRTSLK